MTTTYMEPNRKPAYARANSFGRPSTRTKTRAELENDDLRLENSKLAERLKTGEAKYARLWQQHEDLKAAYASLRNQAGTELQKALALAKEHIPPPKPITGGTVHGVCIKYNRESHRSMLNMVVRQMVTHAAVPRNQVYEPEAGVQYDVVLLVDYPATSRVEESLSQAINECQAMAVGSFAFVALRWGNPDAAPRMRVSSCEVIELFWDKDAAGVAVLIDHQVNAQNLSRLRQIISSALPAAPENNPVITQISRALSAFKPPWR